MTRTQRAIEDHRKGDAVVFVHDAAGRPCAGVPVWVEQEAHTFPFGCVVPDLSELSEADRFRRHVQLAELFVPLDPPAAGRLHFDAPDHVHLGLLRVHLDGLARDGAGVAVHVRGTTIGPAGGDERAAARRITDLYTLCFAHPAVREIVWDGERGLLRRDFSPTAAFRVLQKLIHMIWHTRAEGVTDADGRFAFRGFFGDYRVGVRIGEETKVECFALRSGEASIRVPIPAVP